MNIGQQVRLVGKTLKGKNRIREHGDLWLVSDIREEVISKNGKKAVALVSVKTDEHGWPSDSRWVAVESDDDFTIEEEQL